jgi:hypothetical protein
VILIAALLEIRFIWEVTFYRVVFTDVSENILPSSSGPCSPEILYCFETSVNVYQSTWRNILEDMKFSGYGLYD